MRRVVVWLVLLAWLTPVAAEESLAPAAGKLLVATEEIQGAVFAKTVILLLHYDESGAMGIVINRPTDVEPEEVVDDVDAFAEYNGKLFWGGPVQMYGLRAMMRGDQPLPEDAEEIVDSVYLVPVNGDLEELKTDTTSLRFYIGYAGWAAGQLEGEMARGSWHVAPATAEHVFAENPGELWKTLRPPPLQYRVAVPLPPQRGEMQ